MKNKTFGHTRSFYAIMQNIRLATDENDNCAPCFKHVTMHHLESGLLYAVHMAAGDWIQITFGTI